MYHAYLVVAYSPICRFAFMTRADAITDYKKQMHLHNVEEFDNVIFFTYDVTKGDSDGQEKVAHFLNVL